MKYIIKSVTLLATLLWILPLGAQVPRGRLEKAGNRTEIMISKSQLDRDVSELEEFREMATTFKEALVMKDENVAYKLQLSLLEAMDREIRQSERKTTSDRREVHRSSKEVKNSNRDLRQSNQDRAMRNDRQRDDIRDVRDDRRDRRDDMRDVRDDRRDRRDDIRDLNDDQNDFTQQSNRTIAQKTIRDKFAAWVYQERIPADIEAMAEIRLLNTFISSMEHDIKATRAEIGEDRIENMEDRRELREDKRERRENRE